MKVHLALLTLVASSAPARAWGQAPPPLPPGMVPDEPLEDEARATPRAADERTGHFVIRGTTEAFLPVGLLDGTGSVEDVFAGGFLAGGSLAVFLTPNVALEGAGSFGLLGATSDCDSCAGDAVTAGLGVRAHLVEGAALDPWIRFGMGYRRLSVERSGDEISDVLAVAPGVYHGVDLARLALGAEFAPVRGFSFGPYLAVDLGTNVAFPSGAIAESNPYAFFSVGVSLALDPLGLAAESTPATQAASGSTPAASADGAANTSGRRDELPRSAAPPAPAF
jgi:hypothetical protein